MKENTGALVAGVTARARRQGRHQGGDVILKFDGKDVDDDARPAAPRGPDADRQGVDVELLRKGQRTNLNVAVGRLTEERRARKASDGHP